MKRVLVAYYSLNGMTEMMAQYIGEGIRFSGQEAVVKKISDLKLPDAVAGFDGYLFGSPTHFRDVPEPMKAFMRTASQSDLEGRLGGAFGSYTHDGGAAASIFDTLRYAFKMEPFELGALSLKETMFEQPGRGQAAQVHYVAGEAHGEVGEGRKACQDYGKVFGQRVAK
jgi:flavodoxin